MLGVLLSDLRNPFFGEISSAILRRAREHSLEVVFSTGDRDRRLEEAAIDSMLELRADGLILAGTQVDEAVLERAAAEAPVVVLNRHLESAVCDSVTDDDFAGGRLATEHLVALGHQRIAHVDGGPGAGAAPRRRGYEQAMIDNDLGSELRIVEGSFTEEGGYHGARALLRERRRPTAIFAANDLAAVGVLSALDEAGVSVPEEVSIVGYDNSSLASLRHVSLTSVDQATARLGATAVDRLIERLEAGRTVAVRDVTKPSLVTRRTTAPLRAEGDGE
jgi:DNA-binding LacI/PurR family transcriptional regulator